MPTNNNIFHEVSKLSVSRRQIFCLYGDNGQYFGTFESLVQRETIWQKILFLILEKFLCTNVLLISFHFDLFNSRRHDDLKKISAPYAT